MKSWIKYAVILIAMGCASFALSDQFSALPKLIGSVYFLLVTAVVIGLVVYQIFNAGVWADVLACIGLPRNRWACTRIWLESESLKWLPGGVWSYGSRIFLSSEIGVDKKKAGSSMVLELIITNIAWGLLALSLFLSFPIIEWGSKLLESHDLTIYLLVLISLAVIGVGVVKWKLDKIKTFLDIGPINKAKCVRTLFHYLCLCVFNASLLWVLIQAIPGVEVPYSIVIGITAAAWLCGFWAIGIPGGIGVREAVIVGFLCQFTNLENAILVAALWRVCQMLAEVSSISLVAGSGLFKKGKQIKNSKPEAFDDENSFRI